MELARDLAAVLLVLGALAATLWALRRAGAARWRGPGGARLARGRIEVVERVALSPQQALHLVRLGAHALLIASHAGGCTLVASVPWQEARVAPPREQPS
jgi:flagellar biogenesis protein FliO